MLGVTGRKILVEQQKNGKVLGFPMKGSRMFGTGYCRGNESSGLLSENMIERSDTNKQLYSSLKRGIVAAANSQKEVANG